MFIVHLCSLNRVADAWNSYNVVTARGFTTQERLCSTFVQNYFVISVRESGHVWRPTVSGRTSGSDVIRNCRGSRLVFFFWRSCANVWSIGKQYLLTWEAYTPGARSPQNYYRPTRELILCTAQFISCALYLNSRANRLIVQKAVAKMSVRASVYPFDRVRAHGARELSTFPTGIL